MRLRFTASARGRRQGAQEASQPFSGPSTVEKGLGVARACEALRGAVIALAWHAGTETVLAILSEDADAGEVARVVGPELSEAIDATFDHCSFDYDRDQAPDGWFTATLLWPPDPDGWLTSEVEAIERDHQLAIALARSPLPPE